jgi:hypothetical protein
LSPLAAGIIHFFITMFALAMFDGGTFAALFPLPLSICAFMDYARRTETKVRE